MADLEFDESERPTFDALISKKLVYECKNKGEMLCAATNHGKIALDEARKLAPVISLRPEATP